jgi:hypothetical protein
MSETPWPLYSIGDHKSVSALGVASVKYAELEATFTLIFALATEIPGWTATEIVARCGSNACIQLAYQALPSLEKMGPPTRAESEIRYFLKAFEQCTENRALLMHSSVFHQGVEDHAVLYKTSKQGKKIISLQPLAKMRQMADDMEAYINYGRSVVNAIGNWGTLAPPALFPWPSRPAPPHSLDYKAGPIPVPRTRPIPQNPPESSQG